MSSGSRKGHGGCTEDQPAAWLEGFKEEVYDDGGVAECRTGLPERFRKELEDGIEWINGLMS